MNRSIRSPVRPATATPPKKTIYNAQNYNPQAGASSDFSPNPAAASSPALPYDQSLEPRRSAPQPLDQSLYDEVTQIRTESEAREALVADLRRQITELLPYRQQSTERGKQLSLLDERVRSRDQAQQARVHELESKLQLH